MRTAHNQGTGTDLNLRVLGDLKNQVSALYNEKAEAEAKIKQINETLSAVANIFGSGPSPTAPRKRFRRTLLEIKKGMSLEEAKRYRKSS